MFGTVVLGLQLAAHGDGADVPAAGGGRGDVRHRRPLHRRRALLRRRPARARPHRLPAVHGGDERAAARAVACGRDSDWDGSTSGSAGSTRRQPWLLEWLRHPLPTRRGAAGRCASAPTARATSGIDCPTMLIAGWADGYRNNTFRTVEQHAPGRGGCSPARGCTRRRPPLGPGPNVDGDRRDHARSSTSTSATASPSHAHLRPGLRAPAVAARTRPGSDERHVARVRRLAARRTPHGERAVRRHRARRRRTRRARRRGHVRRGTRARVGCPGASRSTSAPTTRRRSPTTGPCRREHDAARQRRRCGSASDRRPRWPRVGEAVRRGARRHRRRSSPAACSTSPTSAAGPVDSFGAVGPRADAAGAGRVARRHARVRGHHVDARARATGCAWRSPAPTGRTAGRPRSRSRSASTATRWCSTCPSPTCCPPLTHEFVAGPGRATASPRASSGATSTTCSPARPGCTRRYGETLRGHPRHRGRPTSTRVAWASARPTCRRRGRRATSRPHAAAPRGHQLGVQADADMRSDAHAFHVELT